ncbi:MAG: carbon-nitrogen hydrolase family protein [Pseudomonadales bacterium]
MGRSTRTAVLQLCATPVVEENLATAERLSRAAASDGAEVVLWPEAFAFLGPEAAKVGILEPLPEAPDRSGPKNGWPIEFTPGPILARCVSLARELGIHLVLGGFHERGEGEGRNRNTCVHLAPDGGLLALYRKLHLFDIDLADGTRLRESARTDAGDTAITTDLPFGMLGLSICYDLRFPYLYQRLVDLGAIALTAPSAFTATTGAAHWEVLLRARAIECQSYMLAPAQYGAHWGSRRSHGHAMIVDPWGRILDECPGGDGFAIADIDPERVAEVRRELPSLSHRRQSAGGAFFAPATRHPPTDH